MTDPPAHRFPGRDGLELAYREMGDGRPLVLLHGFTSSGMQWVHHGPARTIAEHGYRVILPDLRGHGDSGRPHDPVSYPPDVLADDGFALIDWLGLGDCDLGGYSLGGRVATPEAALRQVATPTLVVIGDQDNDHASADALAARLPDARFTRVPGSHFTALTRPEFATAIMAFLGDRPHEPTS